MPGPPPATPAGYAGMSARQFIIDPILDAIKPIKKDGPIKDKCK